jgi:hypothetical protein
MEGNTGNLLRVYCTLRVIVLKSFEIEVQTKQTVKVDWADRWQVYQRLQELDVPCWCETNQPLTVEICNVLCAVQLWSVMRQSTATRQEQISTLKRCWRKRVK